ncbi:MAG: MtnX-like HAD-IB family phosphatase [Cyanobacteria bacterium REEB67]|jgi:2-hydroxy-3-keto-5-methylthiopentenyl-1-phosphate phosphatase|nr:MtnX-like HAD-IB family phosphatase [Cyanobacteria bacterium REEB67]
MSSLIDVYCDFDGTITVYDTIDVLLEKLADPSWQDIEERWVNGEIGSRECMALQVPLIRGGWPAVAEVLQDVKIDRTFVNFAKFCRANGVPLRIVSDGMDRVIHTVLKREGIHVDNVIANHLYEDEDGTLRLSFPYAPQKLACGSGVCKCLVLERGPERPIKAVIGDGRSDFCWAQEADMLFAKNKLLKHCRESKINCVPYEDFNNIKRVMESVLAEKPSSVAQLQPYFA